MTENTGANLAGQLREAFDRSFETLPAPLVQGLRDFAGIRAGEEDYAVALEEIAAIVPVTRLARLPGGPSSLLGAMGWNGDAVFAHGLARLLDRPEGPPRWLLLAAADHARGFAFEELGSYLRVGGGDVSSLDDAPDGAPVRAIVTANGRRRPVLSIPALLNSIGGSNKP
jgi:chemotaxis signal transduction protein